MSRYKGRTYGEQMAELENKQDLLHWKRKFENAMKKKEYREVKDLLVQARDFEFELPIISDSEVLKIRDEVFKKANRR